MKLKRLTLKNNQSLINPQMGSTGVTVGKYLPNGYIIDSFANTPDLEKKLFKLSKRYGISKSAVIRILLDNVAE